MVYYGACTSPFFIGESMKLTNCQRLGLLKIAQSNKHVVICGAAGTGKTFLLSQLLDTIGEHMNVVYCAPTHAAKTVLSDTVKREAFTIHSVLGIHPETYEDEMKFKQSEVPDISDIDYLVVDEVSMLDGALFTIMMDSIPRRCRIIGLGDPYQLQPPKHAPGIISPVFYDDRFERIFLNTIVRQAADNPLIQVATEVRTNGADLFENIGSDGCGVFKQPSVGSMLTHYFEYVKEPDDMLRHSILAYTNEVVDKLNFVVRKQVYETIEPIIADEYLVLQQPVYREFDDGMKELVFHNGETVKVVTIKSADNHQLNLPDLLGVTCPVVQVYKLILRSLDGKQTFPIEAIFCKTGKADLEYYLFCAASHYKHMSKQPKVSRVAMRNRWDAFWTLKNRFVETKGAGAQTYHKSQGSTKDAVFLYNQFGDYVDARLIRQMRYVGVTRAKYFADFV